MRYFFARGNGSDMKTQSRRPTHMALLIASVAVVLFSTAGIAAIKGWRPVSSDVRALQEAPAMSAQEVALTAQKAQRRAKAKARANGRCAECGVIESMREIDRYDGDFGNDAAGALTGVERNEKPLSLKKRYKYQCAAHHLHPQRRAIRDDCVRSRRQPAAQAIGRHRAEWQLGVDVCVDAELKRGPRAHAAHSRLGCGTVIDIGLGQRRGTDARGHVVSPGADQAWCCALRQQLRIVPRRAHDRPAVGD